MSKIAAKNALTILGDLNEAVKEARNLDALCAVLSKITGVDTKTFFKKQLDKFAEHFQDITGDEKGEQEVNDLLEKVRDLANRKYRYFHSSYYEFVSRFEDTIRIFRSYEDDRFLFVIDQIPDMVYYELTNKSMTCTVGVEKAKQKVKYISFSTDDARVKFDPVEVTKVEKSEGYPRAESAWFGLMYDAKVSGKLRFFRVNLSPTEFVNWNYSTVDQSLTRWVPKDKEVPDGAPETIDDERDVFGKKIVLKIGVDELFQEFMEKSDMNTFITNVRNQQSW